MRFGILEQWATVVCLMGTAIVYASAAWAVETAPSPKGIVLTVQLDRRRIRARSADPVFATVRIRLPEAPPQVKKRSLAVAFVLDVSGSMQGERLEHAKKATQAMLRRLRPGDRVSVVAFSDQTYDVYSPTGDPDIELGCAAVRGLAVVGGTNMVDGIRLGIAKLKAFGDTGAVRRMFLLGDGGANVGTGDMAKIAAWARDYGAAVSTFGVGKGFDESIMTKIAQVSGGHAYAIDDPAKVTAFFDREFDECRSQAANQAHMVLKSTWGLKLEQVYGHPAKLEAGPQVVSLRDLEYGATVTVLLRFSVKEGGRPGATGKLLAVMSYLDREARDGRQVVGQTCFEWVATAAQEGKRNRYVIEQARAAEACAILEVGAAAYLPKPHGQSLLPAIAAGAKGPLASFARAFLASQGAAKSAKKGPAKPKIAGSLAKSLAVLIERNERTKSRLLGGRSVRLDEISAVLRAAADRFARVDEGKAEARASALWARKRAKAFCR